MQAEIFERITLRKRCSKCRDVKLTSEFPKDRTAKSGIKSKCNKCNQKDAVKWQKTDAGKSSRGQWSKKRRRTLKNRYYTLVRGAKIRGLVCELNYETFERLVINAACHYCEGILPEAGYGLDRMDSSQGYVSGNVVPCCTLCNCFKREMFTYEEMKIFIGPAVREIMKMRAAKSLSMPNTEMA